jgi:cysteine-rich repeat protein
MRNDLTSRIRRAGSGGLLLAILGVASTAYAHGARLPFAQWGGFNASSVRCQRLIARAAGECATARWRAQRACRSAELAGRTCDETATEAIITAARNKALDQIDQYCSERNLTDLQFLGQFDLQGDVVNFCHDWEVAATSAVYGRSTAAGSPTGAQRACIEATAEAVDAVMQFTFRNRRQCMDWVAASPRDAPNRNGLLDSAGRRSNSAHDAIATRLAERCDEGVFAALYRQSPAEFVDAVAIRADCIGAQFYVQDAVLCPAAVCGNAIIEPGESCDDGNTVDGDGCPAACH